LLVNENKFNKMVARFENSCTIPVLFTVRAGLIHSSTDLIEYINGKTNELISFSFEKLGIEGDINFKLESTDDFSNLEFLKNQTIYFNNKEEAIVGFCAFT